MVGCIIKPRGIYMDEIGKKYGRLTVIEKLRKDSHNTWIYLCKYCNRTKQSTSNRVEEK